VRVDSNKRSRKSLDSMTPEELCREATQIKKEVEQAIDQLNIIYTTLYARVRHLPQDGMTHAYLNVANSGKRFSGMVLQASRRTSSTEGRTLLLAQHEIESMAHWVELLERKKKAKEEKQKKSEGRSKDPLEVFFGIPLVSSETSGSETHILNVARSSSDLDDLYGEELT